MTKFYGMIGYAHQTEDAPGVWVDHITEKPYFGDVIRNSRKMINGDGLNKDIDINNNISIVADEYAYDNFHKMRYVTYMGAKWNINSVEVQRPRLILTVGGVYNGQTCRVSQ